MTTIRDWVLGSYEWCLLIILAVMFATMLFAFGAVIGAPGKGITSSDAAAWMQAIGSVLAIVAGFMLGNRQANAAHNSAVNLYERQNQRQRAAFLAIASAAHENALSIKEIFCGATFSAFARVAMYRAESTESILRAMEGIPIHELGDPISVTSWLRISDQLRWIPIYVEAFDADVGPGGIEENILHVNRRCRGEIGRAIEDIEQNFRLLSERL